MEVKRFRSLERAVELLLPVVIYSGVEAVWRIGLVCEEESIRRSWKERVCVLVMVKVVSWAGQVVATSFVLLPSSSLCTFLWLPAARTLGIEQSG